MNAKQMIAKLDGYGGIIPFNSEELDVTLRALRLLAAAEANDGSTPETDAARLKYAQWKSRELPATPEQPDGWNFARRLERERNGLAARVAVLEEEAARWDAMIAAQERVASNERPPKMATEFVRELANMVQRDGALLPRMQIAGHYRSLASALDENAKLTARVAELERVEEYAVHLTCEVVRAISDDSLCGREIDEILSNALAEQPAGFDAARSK